jgi:hypothetical protein
MSFGLGVGDFITLGGLCFTLWKAFKDVPDSFDEIGRHLGGFHIVLRDLEDQAGDPQSLLNCRGAGRRDDLLQLCDNLTMAMKRLEDLFQAYHRMGKSGWRRLQLSQQDLEQPRKDLLLKHRSDQRIHLISHNGCCWSNGAGNGVYHTRVYPSKSWQSPNFEVGGPWQRGDMRPAQTEFGVCKHCPSRP